MDDGGKRGPNSDKRSLKEATTSESPEPEPRKRTDNSEQNSTRKSGRPVLASFKR